MHVVLAILGICTVISQPAVASSRLGLFHTQEEVWCWRQRAGIDPQGTNGITCPIKYKSAGDVSANSPGDWDRIVASRTAFAANPSAGRWVTPSPIVNGCVDPDGTTPINWPEAPDYYGSTYSFRLRDAAFYALVTGNHTDWPAIKAEILWTTSQSFTQFGNPAGIWCFGKIGDNQVGYWGTSALLRLIFAYEYVGRDNFTAGERDQVERWMFDAADFWRADSENFFNAQYVDRWSGNYTPTSGCSTGADAPQAYVGGPTIPYWYGQIYNNRGGAILRFAHLTGLALQQYGRTYTDGRYGTAAQLVQSAQMYVKEYVRYALYPQGFVSEFVRRTDQSADGGWAYAGTALGEIIDIADAFARAGDSSLYTYNTAEGLCGTQGTINDGGSRQGQNRDLLFAVQSYMKYHTDQYARYWPTISEDWRIDGRAPRNGSTWHGVHDTQFIQSNLYFQDTFIQQAYTRTHPNALPYPGTPQGIPPWQGVLGLFPGILFMFGQMEGVVNPYGGTSSTPTPTPTPGLGVTVDSTYSGYSTGAIDDGVINANGETGTTWASADTATDHWIVIDFGTSRQINSATLHWAYNQYQSAYMTSNRVDVQYWNGSAYQTAATMSYAGNVPSTTVNFPTVTTSRIRFHQPANQGNTTYPGVIWITEADYSTQDPTLPSPPSDLRVISAQ